MGGHGGHLERLNRWFACHPWLRSLVWAAAMSGWFVLMRAEAGALGESRTWVYATGLFGFTLLITFALRQRPPE